MSKSDGEWMPTINQSSSIPELIKYMKHSFRECEFNEVQNMLMDREKKMKMEIENLIRKRDSIKEEARLLKRTQGLAELEKLKFEEKLQKCRKKCEKMKETITRLIEEQRVSSDRAKEAEERYNIVSEEKLKIVKEKNELISELNEKIDQLKNKENEQAELYDSMLQPRVLKVEAALASILNVKVEDLGNLADIINAGGNGENVCWPDISKGLNDIMAAVSPGMRSTSYSTGSGGIELPNKDCRNLVHSTTKEDGTDTVHTSPGTQSDCSFHAESDVVAQDNEGEEPLDSGPRSDGGLPIRDKSPFVDIIEICDSDDEGNPGDATYTTSDLTNKRNRGDSPVNLTAKRKRSIFISDGEDDPPIVDKENQVLESSHDRSEVDSEDESYSDGHMEDLIATLRSKCNGK